MQPSSIHERTHHRSSSKKVFNIEYPLEAILAIYFLSVTGHLPDKFPHDQWIEAVRWHGDTKIAATIHTEAEWADAKIILATLENVVVEAESQHRVVVWSSAQNCPPTIPTDPYPLQLKSNGTSLRPCMWKQRDSGVGTSCTLSPGISRSDRIKKGSRSTDLRLLRWKKRSMFLASLEARKPCRSLHWAGVRLPMNSWCCITLDWTVPSIGMYSCLKSCLRFSSRVPQPAGLLLWKCMVPRTSHVKRHTRATLQNPGHQGTYGGGMSDAPENSKNSNTVSPGSQVPH